LEGNPLVGEKDIFVKIRPPFHVAALLVRARDTRAIRRARTFGF
jgi:hypothetical protein